MKKIFISVCAILVILGIFWGINVNAIENVKLAMESKNSVSSESTVEVKVALTGKSDNGITGFQGDLKYDSNYLEYVDQKTDANGWQITGFNSENGRILIESNVANEDTIIHDKQNVVVFTFKAKEVEKAVSTTVEVNNVIVSLEDPTDTDSQLKDTSFTKTITIEPVSSGDNTTNNIVNNTTNNIVNNTANNIVNNTANNIVNNTANNIVNNTANNIVNNTANNIVNNTANNTVNNTTNITTNNTVNNTSNASGSGDTSTKTLPKTGIDSIISKAIVGAIIMAVVFYIGLNKYKDIY